MKDRRLADIVVRPDQTLWDTLEALDRSAMGIAFVCREGMQLVGTVTDGDIRRALLRGATLQSRVGEHMQTKYVWVPTGAGRSEVLDLMRFRSIAQIPVLDEHGRLHAVHTMRELIGASARPNRAVVMAGGKGTRLRPLTETVPKPMIKVAGRPMLERIILHLVGYGIRHVYLSVNYLAHIVEDHFGDGEAFGCQIEYLREDKPLGTGGCLSLLPEVPDAPLLVMNGDLVTQADIGRMLDFHDTGEYDATVGARPFTVQVPFGVLDTEGERLVGLREKPAHQVLVSAGMYVLSPDIVQMVPAGVEYPVTSLFHRCLDEGHAVGVHLLEDDWADVGRPEELLKANGVL